MRRLLTALLAILSMTGMILILPVYVAPLPETKPVKASTDEVPMGSVAAPAPAADVQQGTTEPVEDVSDRSQVLTVTRTGVDPFSLVGVTWRHDPAVVDVVVQVRVQDARGAWGAWTEIGTEDAEENRRPVPGVELRGSTEPLWTGPSTGVEAELVTRSGAQPTDVQLDLIDPGKSAADSALGTPDIQDTADAALAMPDVHSRAQWGADESKMTWTPEYAPTLKAATLHHTAGSNGYTADQVPAIMRGIYHYHAVNNGWGDIGYNVVVDKFGRLCEGRRGGLARTVVGAHAGGFNSGTFGVSMLGNYDQVDTPQVMVDAVAAIIAWKFSLFGVDPHASVTLTSGGGTSKYPAGTRVSLPTVFGHRDVKSTSCPGKYGVARMGEIRAKAAGRLAAAPQLTIKQRYDSDAAVRTLLGAPRGVEQVVAGVTVQEYERGAMYWTAATGPHVLRGAIRGVYLAAGGPAVLGAPTTDETSTPDGVGRFNHFAGGSSVYWTQATGAHLVMGQIRALWQRTGWERGPLGYPTSGELAGAGGRYNTFQGGTVYWTPTAGAVEVHGHIAARWRQLGGLQWAVPTSSERAVGSTSGRYNTFAGNRAIYWSPATGAHFVQGQIRSLWAAKGGTFGVLGYPTADERSAGDGVFFSTFQRGAVYWTAANGAHAVEGEIARKWTALGALNSGFGIPVTDETTTPDRVGRYNHFAKGASIYWSPATGANSVRGAIRDVWAQLGWEGGSLGYPTRDEQATADGRGRVSTFGNGAVYWTQARGAYAVYGAINARYAALGGVKSALGYPTSHEFAVSGGRASNFERGRITWNARTGAVTVTYR